MPHQETIACVEKARILLEAGDIDSLRYATLQLRMGIEYLFYELVPLYREELPDDILTASWQPQRILDALLECDPEVDKDTRMAVGIFDDSGENFKADTILQMKAPTKKILKKHYHRLGFYLHAPVELKNPPAEKWKTDLEAAIASLSEYSLGQALVNFRCLIDIDCVCGRKIKRNKRAIEATGIMQCHDPDCRAVWDVRLEGDETHASLRQESFVCRICQTENFFPASKIKDGLRIDCVECGKRLLVNRRAIQIVDVDAKILHKPLIFGPSDAKGIPSEFDFNVYLVDEYGQTLDGYHALTLESGKTGTARAQMVWLTGDNPPPMVAVVRALFVVRYMHNLSIETPAWTFVLQSERGAIEATVAATDPKRAAEHVAVLGAIEGKKSVGFVTLLKLLRERENQRIGQRVSSL